MTDALTFELTISALVFVAAFVFVAAGWRATLSHLARREAWYRRVLVEQLLLDIEPRVAVYLSVAVIFVAAAGGYALVHDWPGAVIGAVVAFFLPRVVIRHLEQKRKERLDQQAVDGVRTLASGVRAGLNLVQSIELLVKNSQGPIKQEFAQLLREYQMGLDLNQAMRNAANRIGSSHYRLLFTAIEMHRQRGGDVGQSLDRIAEAIREIQRLEGKLETLTAPGRTQARMMAGISIVILGILYSIDPEGVRLLFSEPRGRIVLLVVATMMIAGFAWIRRIVAIDL
jgi:tight adherence protein B